MTTITGKDAPLEVTIGQIEAALQTLGIELIIASELTPVPYCFSAHLQARGYERFCTNGKGTSSLASRVSGMAEFVERLATDFFFSDYYLGTRLDPPFSSFPDEVWFSTDNADSIEKIVLHSNTSPHPLLSPELLDFYDKERDLEPDALFDNNFDGTAGAILALPYTRIKDGKDVYFPLSLLNNLYVSNGMAAGNSRHEAQSQALSEIIERYVKNIVIAEGLSLPEVPDEQLSYHPHLFEIKNSIEQHGFSITIHDSSLGGKFPVICVILIDKNSGGVYAAFGANCRFEIAIERTLTELLQGRQLDELQNFSPPVHNPGLVAAPYNLESHFIDSDGLLAWSMFKDEPDFPFSPWFFGGTTQDEKDHLVTTITARGFDIYTREYTHCDFYACRILVPGMSEIYPVEDLAWNNKNRGSLLRRKLLRVKNMDREKLSVFYTYLEDEAFDDMQLISHITGVLFDSESNWDTLRIGELKAHVLLALQRYDEAVDWCNWVIEFGGVSRQRKRQFRVIATWIEFVRSGEESGYGKNLQRFFTNSEIEKAQAIAAGSTTFFGLQFASSWEDLSQAHSDLLQLYNRLKNAKIQPDSHRNLQISK